MPDESEPKTPECGVRSRKRTLLPFQQRSDTPKPISAGISQEAIRSAVTRYIHPPKPDTIRLWTIQPPHVWNSLREQGTLLVDPNHAEFAEPIDDYRAAYDWMRQQMARRIPGYAGHYPWWAYEHLLDLRFYRWHTRPYGKRLIRLELAVPRAQVLLSAYGGWHCVLDRGYLPASLVWEDYERELDTWEEEAARHGVNVHGHAPFVEPWEAQLQASWERVFDVEERRPEETIQATFERLELGEVVKVTEFTSMPERSCQFRECGLQYP